MMRGRAVWMRAVGLCCAAAMMVGMAGCASEESANTASGETASQTDASAQSNDDAASQTGVTMQSDDAGPFLCNTSAFEEADPGQTYKDGGSIRLRKKGTGLEFTVPYDAKTPHLYYDGTLLTYVYSCRPENMQLGYAELPSISIDVLDKGASPENLVDAGVCTASLKRDDQGRVVECDGGATYNRYLYGNDGTAFEGTVHVDSEHADLDRRVADGLDLSLVR